MCASDTPGRAVVGFYLGRPVEPVRDHGDGWLSCRWPDGRVYRHWAEQIKVEPWGQQSIADNDAMPVDRVRGPLLDDVNVERHDTNTPDCAAGWCCDCALHPIGKPWGWNVEAWDRHYQQAHLGDQRPVRAVDDRTVT